MSIIRAIIEEIEDLLRDALEFFLGLAVIALVAGAGYVVAHFIVKYW